MRERFDVVEAKRNGAEEPLPSIEATNGEATSIPPPLTNGVRNGVHKFKSSEPSAPSASSTPAKREATEDSLSDVIDSAPPKKKRKPSAEDDAVIAARLQAEENSRARPTRGGGPRKTAPVKKKKTPKKKSQARVGSDDSEVEDSPKKVNRNTGFHKPLNLSPALSSLLDGETQMSRPQVTKRIWDYIKANDLQEPDDRRFIRVDDRMREVFKQDKVHMFTMTKIVNQHMFNPEETA